MTVTEDQWAEAGRRALALGRGESVEPLVLPRWIRLLVDPLVGPHQVFALSDAALAGEDTWTVTSTFTFT